jgi:hypothetical protein
MGGRVRIFLFTDRGLRHLSRKTMQTLYDGTGMLPEYAGTSQHGAEVAIMFENKEPVQIIRMLGVSYQFDSRGALVRERSVPGHPLTEDERAAIRERIWPHLRKPEEGSRNGASKVRRRQAGRLRSGGGR